MILTKMQIQCIYGRKAAGSGGRQQKVVVLLCGTSSWKVT
jgi:hypothetical protein